MIRYQFKNSKKKKCYENDISNSVQGQPDICNNKDEAVQSTGTCDESSDSSENDQVHSNFK